MEKQQNKDEMNVGNLERKVSIIGGGALLLHALKQFSFKSIIPAILGADLIYRGITGHCRIYEALDVNTAAEPNNLKKEAEALPERLKKSETDKETSSPAKRTKTQKRNTGQGGKISEYRKWTKEKLYLKAKQADIEGRSKMSKDQLIKALQKVN